MRRLATPIELVGMLAILLGGIMFPPAGLMALGFGLILLSQIVEGRR